MTAFLVMLGGAIGSLLRYVISLWIGDYGGDAFPWATLFVNVAGSFGVGLFAGLTTLDGILLVSPEMRIFVTVGLFGGFTTFSSFSFQTLNLVQNGEWFAAGGNIFFSVILCLFAVWIGHGTALSLNNLFLK